MARSKDVLTTGEVAKICKVAPRTVTKWFDSGQLRGYRIPGSKDRRIPVSSRLIVLGVSENDEAEIVDMLQTLLNSQTNYDVQSSQHGFEAGLLAERLKPHVILLDIHLGEVNGRDVCKAVRMNPELQFTKVIAMSGVITDQDATVLLQQGFDGYLKKPFNINQVIEAIEDAVAVVY